MRRLGSWVKWRNDGGRVHGKPTSVSSDASDRGEIEVAFATARQRADALIVGADGFFFRRRIQLATSRLRDKSARRLYVPRVRSRPAA